jgi:diguanylate cyclase (GGDEF)-like protein
MVRSIERLPQSASKSALGTSNMEDVTTLLLAARSVGDIRDCVLPLIRRHARLVAIAIEFPHALTALADGTFEIGTNSAELPLEAVGGKLKFQATALEPATRMLTQLAPLLGASIRNALDFERLYRLAVTDPLTDLYNRRFFDEALERELSGALRHGRELAILAIDLDGFKAINDSAGHLAGDGILVGVARALRSATRRSDIVARTGGDEFLVLVIAGNHTHSRTLAGRILRHIQAIPTGGPRLSASVGIATAPPCPTSPSQLLRRADRALYRAKQLGRGRAVLLPWDASDGR